MPHLGKCGTSFLFHLSLFSIISSDVPHFLKCGTSLFYNIFFLLNCDFCDLFDEQMIFFLNELNQKNQVNHSSDKLIKKNIVDVLS